MRVIPIGAPGVIGRDADLDVVALPGLHRPEDVVGQVARTHMRAMKVKIRRIEVMRQGHVDQHRIGIGRKVVDEPDVQNIAGPNAQCRARDVSLVSAQKQPITANILVGVANPQRGLQRPID